jgi:hypothetical protein
LARELAKYQHPVMRTRMVQVKDGLLAAEQPYSEVIERILTEKLKPMLEAGQAMRDHEMEHPSGYTRWDAALEQLRKKP